MGVILDTAIGLVLIIFLFSLLASALQEMLAAIRNNRGRMLGAAVIQLLDGALPSLPSLPPRAATRGETLRQRAAWVGDLFSALGPGLRRDIDETTLGGAVLRSGMLAGLLQRERLPSYIPADRFADAMIDVMRRLAHDAAPTLEGLHHALTRLPAGKPRSALEALLADATDVGQFRTAVIGWYADAMERVSGWYLRHVRYVLLVIGLALAIGMNADVFYLWGRIAVDSALRDSLVKSAVTTVAPRPADVPGPGASQTANKAASDQSVSAAAAQASATAQILNSLNLPMGWPACNFSKPDPNPQYLNACNPSAPWDWLFVVRAALGWVLMAFAISLGAPFWFDLLQRLLQLRAAGVKPDDASMSAAKLDAVKSSATLSGPSPTSPAVAAETPRNDFERTQLSVHDFRLIQACLGASQTGQPDDETRRAIANFQRKSGLPADGALTATLARSIVRAP